MSDNLTRLSLVLGMMGSAHDGEVLNAAKMVERIRRDMDKSWSALLTGASDSGGGNGLLRAMRAEARALAAESRASELEGRVRQLECGIAEMRSGTSSGTTQKPRSSSTKPDVELDPETERRLIDGLLNGGAIAAWIIIVTGWERPLKLKTRLARLARKHGLRLKTPVRDYYVFYRY